MSLFWKPSVTIYRCYRPTFGEFGGERKLMRVRSENDLKKLKEKVPTKIKTVSQKKFDQMFLSINALGSLSQSGYEVLEEDVINTKGSQYFNTVKPQKISLFKRITLFFSSLFHKPKNIPAQSKFMKGEL